MSFDIALHVKSIVVMLNSWFAEALNGNTLVAGAATASIMASVAYFARKQPRRLWLVVKRWIVFTYYIEYDLDKRGQMIHVIAKKFELELQRRVSKRRASARPDAHQQRLVETLADGGFFFKYEGTWIWISRAIEQAAGATDKSKPNRIVKLSLTTLRFGRSKIMKILTESAREYVVPGVYQVSSGGFNSSGADFTRVRNFTSIPPLALDRDVKREIDEAIDNFLAHRDANNAEDKLHKLVFLWHGEPGTGKSALGEYVAFRLKTSLFVMNALTNAPGRGQPQLGDVISGARNCIASGEIPVLLVDDFDTHMHGIRRDAMKYDMRKGEHVPYESGEHSAELGQLLASLQSPVEISDCVVMFTTNCLDKIDPAMYRPGRVTKLIHIGRMQPYSVMEYFGEIYSRPWPEHVPIERSLRACDVSAYGMENVNNPQGFINAVITANSAADEVFNRSLKEEVAS